MSLSDDQYTKLSTYINEFGPLNSSSDYLYNLQLQFLSNYLSCSTKVIQQNVDLVLRSHPQFNWEKNKLRLMNEVDSIISSFGLRDFGEDFATKPVDEPGDGPVGAGVGARPTATESMTNPTTNPMTEPKEMPKLTKTQRRMSLDLMHTPNVYHRRHSSKPAVTETSNVNVLTKADLSPSQPKTLAVKQESLDIVQPRPKPQPLTDKRSRRISLVGENLPIYIKDQLNSKPKKLTRVDNLLHNSQSLYMSKDLNSIKSDSQTHTTNSDVDNTDPRDDDRDDDDREYILPNSFTRDYETNDDDDDDDEVDFVNVNSSEEEEEEEEEEEDSQDYLFTV